MSSPPRPSRRLVLVGLGALALPGCTPPLRNADLLATAPHEPYRLSTGDRVRVIVFGQDSLSNVYPVDDAGRVPMPLAGPVNARGLTAEGLAREIEGKLRAGYIREPKVSVDVETYRPFYVLGEVTAAGRYPFVSGTTVQTAVAIAGGFTPRARRDLADLTRETRAGAVTGTVPIDQPVRPGDVITIRERWF